MAENRLVRRDGTSPRGTNGEHARSPASPLPMTDSQYASLLRDVDRTRSLTSRLRSIDNAKRQIQVFTPEQFMRFWGQMSDMSSSGSSTETRHAVFDLVQEWQGLSNLQRTSCITLVRDLAESVDSSLVEIQVATLQALYRQTLSDQKCTSKIIILTAAILGRQHESLLKLRHSSRRIPDFSETQQQQEKGLQASTGLLAEIISGPQSQISEEDLGVVVDQLLKVIEITTEQRDIQWAFEALHTISRSRPIPESHMQRFVEVSCATISAVPELRAQAWKHIAELCSLATGAGIPSRLLTVLALASEDTRSHAVCGALVVLQQLVEDQSNESSPPTSIALLETIFELRTSSQRVRRGILACISAMVQSSSWQSSSNIEHLRKLLACALAAASGTDVHSVLRSMQPDSNQTAASPLLDWADPSDFEARAHLLRLSLSMSRLWLASGAEVRELIAKFLLEGNRMLQGQALETLIQSLRHESQAQLAVTDLMSTRLQLAEGLLPSLKLPQSARTLLFELFVEEMAVKMDTSTHAHYRSLIDSLTSIAAEQPYWQLTTHFSQLLLVFWTRSEFQDIDIEKDAQALVTIIASTKTTAPDDYDHLPPKSDQSASGRASKNLACAFGLALELGSPASTMLFEQIVRLASLQTSAFLVRAAALDVLLRLRSSTSGLVFLMPKVGNSSALDSSDDMWVSVAGDTAKSAITKGDDPEQIHVHEKTESPNFLATLIEGDRGRPSLEHTMRQRPVTWTGYSESEERSLRIAEWFLAIIEILQDTEGDWQVFRFVLENLPAQLSNPALMVDAGPHIKFLRNLLVSQLQNETMREPPVESGWKRGDVAFALLESLIILLGYSSHFTRGEQDDLVRTFLSAMSSWDRTARASIHALALSCHAIPGSVAKSLTAILQKLSQVITQGHLAVDVLEFLGGLARLPQVYVNFREDDFRMVFGVCVRYLEHSREQRLKLVGPTEDGTDFASAPNETSSKASVHSEALRSTDIQTDLPQYVFALAYHVLTIWFLSVKITDRPRHVSWITRNLGWRDSRGIERMEEQSQVLLDMMHRTAYLDLGESSRGVPFSAADGKVLTKTWLVGMSIITIETATNSGISHLIKRQASGTTYAIYQQQTAPLPPHQTLTTESVPSSVIGSESRINIFPNHVFLQLLSNVAPTPGPMEPIYLPDDESSRRAITAFDRNDTVDGYRVGVIYIGPNQSSECEILRNTRGTTAFDRLLSGLGTRVELKGAPFNTQGLDRQSDTDGSHTIAWRDRVVEIIFHVPTMMPNDQENDPQCINKKKHIGNNYVNIVYNDSGLPFNFSTFPSQCNYVYIVITPEACSSPVPSPAGDVDLDHDVLPAEEGRSAFRIQTMTGHGLPEISPTAVQRLMPPEALGPLARQLALNCAVFCNVWALRDGGQHVSSWRNRLREIAKLRERHASDSNTTAQKYPEDGAVRTYHSGDSFRGRVEMGGLADEEDIFAGLNFVRWSGPP